MSHFFYITPKNINLKTNTALLDGEEWVHASKVLRLKVSHAIDFFDGQGNIYSARIIGSGTPKSFDLKITEIKKQPIDYSLAIYVGMPKGRKIDLIVNALTQIGATTIGTFISRHTIAKAAHEKEERLRKIAIEACKQSSRAWVPKIRNGISFKDLLRAIDAVDETIVFYEDASLYQAINSFKMKNTAIVIGPEGGFSEREIELLTEKGAILSRLSDGILRVETAAIAAAHLARYSQLS